MGNSNFVGIVRADLEINTPMPWTVYDGDGNLLLRKGFVITSERQLQALLDRGLHRIDDQEEEKPKEESLDYRRSTSAFELTETLIGRLERTFRMLGRVEQEFFPYRIMHLAIDIQGICHDSPDAMLAVMQLDTQSPYGIVHALHRAILCELVAKRMKLPQTRRLTLLCAALTLDIAFFELQEVLHKQKVPLTDDQWDEIQRHPQEGHDLLVATGVNDKVWLECIMQHHERLDGSGYPRKLQGEAITTPSRLVAIADMYTAMIRPRTYRAAILAKDALRDIFNERGATIDEKLAHAFISVVGIFPPGGFVRLKNMEVAVVKERGEDPSFPPVFSIASANGMPYNKPIERNPRQDMYSIVEMVSHERFKLARNTLANLWPLMRPLSSG